MAQTWQDLLRGGFAYQTAPFAVHPLDYGRAREMVYLARHHKISIADICHEARNYLSASGCDPMWISEEIERIETFYKSIKFQIRKKTAWIVFWDEVNSKYEYPQEIVAIFRSQKSGDFVRDFVFNYYISSICSLGEKVHYSSHSKDFPYQVDLERIDGIPWGGLMHCGHNPFLVARYVKNLALLRSEDGIETVHWENPPRPRTAV